MPDLLDCLMPACHQAGVITTPAVASVTFPAVIAAVALAVTIHRMACPMRSPTRGLGEPAPGAASCTPVAVGQGRNLASDSLLPCPRAGCRRALTAGAEGVEMHVRYRLCEHRSHAEEKSPI